MHQSDLSILILRSFLITFQTRGQPGAAGQRGEGAAHRVEVRQVRPHHQPVGQPHRWLYYVRTQVLRRLRGQRSRR